MYELIVKFACDEMNIRRCIKKKSIAVQFYYHQVCYNCRKYINKRSLPHPHQIIMIADLELNKIYESDSNIPSRVFVDVL